MPPGFTRKDVGIVVALAVLCIAVYGRTAAFPFVNYDDPHFIFDNPSLRGGLSLESIRWAFTTELDTQWIPLTWLSRLLDVSLFGMDAGRHHLVNVFFHLANTILLYVAFRRMTRNERASALVAALFAVHPLHVESVAWVTERKDLLSAFFFLLTVLAYLRYYERPRVGRYLVALSLFVLGLLSKPILVTVPFVLLLLDVWPLARFSPAAGAEGGTRPSFLLLEKVPFMAITVLFCMVMLRTQSTIPSLNALVPLWARAGNALVAAADYLRKAAWPSGLTIFYPHPGRNLVSWHVASAGLVLCAVSAWAVGQHRRRPWVFVGWFWFLGMLVPVLGLVPLGSWAMADRYTYLPLIGLSIVPAWFLEEMREHPAVPRAVSPTLGVALVLALATVASHQVGYWRDSVPLFEHALEVTKDNYVAHNQLGHALYRKGLTEEAIPHFREALRIFPDFAEPHHNLGLALLRLGRSEEAASHFRETIRIVPTLADAYNNLGVVLVRSGKREEAMGLFREAIRLRPGYVAAKANLDKAGREP